jgi:hypothetical protein
VYRFFTMFVFAPVQRPTTCRGPLDTMGAAPGNLHVILIITIGYLARRQPQLNCRKGFALVTKSILARLVARGSKMAITMTTAGREGGWRRLLAACLAGEVLTERTMIAGKTS